MKKAQTSGIHIAADIFGRNFASLRTNQTIIPTHTRKAAAGLILVADIAAADRLKPGCAQQLAGVITQTNKAFHKNVMSHKQ